MSGKAGDSESRAGQRSWALRDYAPGDERSIIELFERVFGKPMGPTESRRHWDWEFAQNPMNAGMFIKLAWDGTRLAGHYAVNPLRVCVDGEELMAALSLDTMTDADYRGQGVFPVTAEALYSDLAESGAAFVFGFPNVNSIRGILKRLYWKEIMPPPVLIRPLSLLHAAEWESRSRLLRASARLLGPLVERLPALPEFPSFCRLEVRPVESFGDWADDLWSRCRGQHRIWTVRDRAYLEWRYAARPETDYRVCTVWSDGAVAGYVVTLNQEREVGNVCFIMDFLVDLKIRGAASRLLRDAVVHARRSRSSMLCALVAPASRYRSAFLRHLFLPLPRPLFPQDLHFGGRRFSDAVGPETFEDPSCWSISWGDNDVL